MSHSRPDRFVIDELSDQLEQTRKLLLGRPDEALERAVHRLQGDESVELRLAAELADTTPIADPARFHDAHRLTLHALEVLDRHGASNPPVHSLLPFKGLIRAAIGFVTDYVVSSYAASVVGKLERLYARRQGQCAEDDPQRNLLANAREDVERVAPSFAGGGRSAPIIVAVGAAIPALASVSGFAGALPIDNRWFWVTSLAVLAVLFLGLSWTMLRGAALARRRSRLVMQQPLAALWETVGRAGDPPEDAGVTIANVAIILPALAWFAVPAIIGAVLVLT